MKALYSLICRLRTVCALTQGTITLAFEGWAAVPPAQLLVLGCGLCLLVRILVPSPPPGRRPRFMFLDYGLSGIAIGSVAGLTAVSVVDACMLVRRLVLGL